MASEKKWIQHLKLITMIIGVLAALSSLAGAAFTSYKSYKQAVHALEQTKENRGATDSAYAALVEKINSLSEKVAFIEGRLSVKTSSKVVYIKKAKKREIREDSSDANINVYQQLPSDLEELINSQKSVK